MERYSFERRKIKRFREKGTIKWTIIVIKHHANLRIFEEGVFDHDHRSRKELKEDLRQPASIHIAYKKVINLY